MINNKIIDGKFYSEQLLQQLKQKIIGSNIVPTLAIIIVGRDPASLIYVRNKFNQGRKIGIRVKILEFSETVSQSELEITIKKINKNSEIHGIILQLPLPKHINKNTLIPLIDANKDVDGFHPINIGNLYLGLESNFISCTALSCLHLLKTVFSNLDGKYVVIISHSIIVGKPIAALLLQHNCTITICHSYTQNLSILCKQADIIISGIGHPKYIDASFCKQDVVIIDVGINRISAKDNVYIVGDVDLEKVLPYVRHITPVPGGVGPMTVAYLLYNTVKASKIL